jgi:hypothetical protein
MADTVWWSRSSKTIKLMGRWNGGHDGEAICYSSMRAVTFKVLEVTQVHRDKSRPRQGIIKRY